MRIESELKALNACGNNSISRVKLTKLFKGIDNVISCDSHPADIFKTQSNYLNSLSLPEYIESVVLGPAISRYICFNQNDTKSVLYLPQQNLIYDPEPYWLKMLPHACTRFSSHNSFDLIDSEFIFSRGSMSFAHFLSGELGSLLALDLTVNPNVPIFLPFAKKWHHDILKFFGIKRQIVTSLENINSGCAYDVGLSKLHVLDHLEEFQGLCISRYVAQMMLAQKYITTMNNDTCLSPPARILWLTRYNYEKQYSLPFRMINFQEAKEKLSSRFNIEFCNPEEYDIDIVSQKVYSSSILVCESGSLFMNYLLFASRFTKIIQLTPQYCLSPTWSFYNINNMQWYWPVLSHLHYFEGLNRPQLNRKFGSPWNVPSIYDIDKLGDLIANLEKRY